MAKKLCTPFCDGRKPCTEHHELLVALLNCSDQRCSSQNTNNMDEFEQTVKKWLDSGWKREDDVPDPTEGYRFPLIHWACVLGKCQAIQWLLENGFDATIRSKTFQETALHRSVLCLHYTVSRRYEAKVEKIIDIMKECLLVGDADQDTPLHLCAKQLLKCAKREFFGQTLEKMISKAQEMPGLTTKILDAINKDGCTLLHILSCNDSTIIQLRKALEAGADPEIRNKNGLSALEVAVNYGSKKSIKALREVTVNKNERERKKRENPRYLDKDTFICDSPLESPTSTEHGPMDSEDEAHSGTQPSTPFPRRGRTPKVHLSSSVDSHTQKADDVNQCADTGHNSSFNSDITSNNYKSATGLPSEIPSSTERRSKDSEINVHSPNNPPKPRRRGRPPKSQILASTEHRPKGSEVGTTSINKPPKPRRRGRPPRSDSLISSHNQKANFIGHATTNPNININSDIVTSNSDGNAAQGCNGSDEFGVSSTHDKGEKSVTNSSNQENALGSCCTSQIQANSPTAHQADSSIMGESVNGTHSVLSSNCTPDVTGNEVDKDNNEGESHNCCGSDIQENRSHRLGSNEHDEERGGGSAGDSDDRNNNTINDIVAVGDHSYSQITNTDGTRAQNLHSDDAHHGYTTHPTDGSSSNEAGNAPCSGNNTEDQTNSEKDDDLILLNIKTEPLDDYCTCCYEHCQASTSNNNSGCDPPNTSTCSSSTDSGAQDTSLLNLLHGAGLLKNVKEMVGTLREKDEHRLSEIQLGKQRADEELEDIDKACNTKNEAIAEQRQKLEQMKAELDQLQQKREETVMKRKRLDDEGSDLSKKLKCCYDLLKVVPGEKK